EMEIAALRQRIAELESHTVKLPKPISVLHRREFTAAHCAIYAYPEAEVNAALAAAGIKWEVE
ncbi:ead/Ea22-like family protein, partial [Xanthomonas citri pv. citri]|nr:ead/Ea22-like family protein [Xanthomonas citri pv. citri]